jgi:hypothetical protein
MASAIAVFVVATLTIWAGLGAPSAQVHQPLSVNDQFGLMRLALTVVAGVGGVVALVVAYRRQRVIEEDNQRARAAAQRENVKLFTERFTAATAQLGHEQAAVRLAGIYAVASLADDAPTLVLRQACIDVLCGYLRMPYQHDPQAPGWQGGELEVRRAITRIITEHLHREGNAAGPGWHGHRFNFVGAVFDGAYFAFMHIPKGTLLNFLRCRFVAGSNEFQGLEVDGGIVNLYEVEVSGGDLALWGAHVSNGTLSFGCSRFTGGRVTFRSLPPNPEVPERNWTTTFSGGLTDFQGVAFSGSEVCFDGILVSGGKLLFNHAELTGGTITFRAARLKSGFVDFSDATFTGADVRFEDADISPGVLDLRQIDQAC